MTVNLLKKNSLVLVASLLLAGHVQATELLNSSGDVSRELFAALNPPFEQQWAKDNGGDKLTIKQSHAGSSKQALAILQGLKADVVTYNQGTDVRSCTTKASLFRLTGSRVCQTTARRLLLHHGLSWRVRAPRRISTTGTDLVRSDVKLIFPNPKPPVTRVTPFSRVGAADKADGDKAKTEQFMTQFLKNVEVFDTGGRGATTTLPMRGLGDVLISFESEVNNIRKQYEAQGLKW